MIQFAELEYLHSDFVCFWNTSRIYDYRLLLIKNSFNSNYHVKRLTLFERRNQPCIVKVNWIRQDRYCSFCYKLKGFESVYPNCEDARHCLGRDYSFWQTELSHKNGCSTAAFHINVLPINSCIHKVHLMGSFRSLAQLDTIKDPQKDYKETNNLRLGVTVISKNFYLKIIIFYLHNWTCNMT